MVATPQIYTARVMHRRILPKVSAFDYGVYYLVLPLPAAPVTGRLTSFHARDVGMRDGSDPTPWARGILAEYGIDHKIRNIVLITMPRVLGYVFNPVTFYLCQGHDEALIAALCEVHNTFGEQHCYLCANHDHAPITREQTMTAEKVFHVSPFLDRCGHYTFRFDLTDSKLGIWIDYFDSQGNKQLATSLIGSFSPLTRESLQQAFWRHPAVCLKAITLIHWQALKLVMKGIRHIRKPDQLEQKVTATKNLNKM